jgi:flagellar biosynthesis/type III secretory pathway protein FliH
MTKDNDLVKKLRKRQEFEFIDGYKRIEWEDDDALEAADRIEALEAKLAKNEALMQAGFAEYQRRLAKAVEAAYREGFLAGTADGWVNNPRIKVEWKRSKALAELKGDKT